jgi:hypothetical protein
MKKENWIKLESGIKDTLKGKVIDTYAFNKGFGDGVEESHLIIKFTDGTFICVGVELDQLDGCDYILDNKYCPELTSYHTLPYFIDVVNGRFHLEGYIDDRVKMGVIEPMSNEKVEELVNAELEERRNKRYKQYLKLKEEFENGKE